MKTTLLLLLLSSSTWAACPLFTYGENHKLDQEINNVCDNILNPTINYETVTKGVFTSLAVSTLTAVSSATITNLTVTNLIGGPKPLNILINGGFEIWQRGTSFGAYTNPAGEGIYQSDRWKQGDLGGSGSAVWTVAQETGNIDTGVRSLKLNITSLGGGTFGWHMVQLVENYQDYFGQVVTLSVRVKTNSSGGVTCAMDDGVTETIGSSHSGGNAWETLTVTKTISASATKLKVWIGFSGNTATVSTTYLDSAMLVWGSAASSFIGSDKAIELYRCQRYYFKTFDVDVAPVQNSGTLLGALSSSVHTAGVFNDAVVLVYPSKMRTTPTVTTYSPLAASSAWWNASLGAASGAATVLGNNGTGSVGVRNAQVAGDGTGQLNEIHVTADAEM